MTPTLVMRSARATPTALQERLVSPTRTLTSIAAEMSACDSAVVPLASRSATCLVSTPEISEGGGCASGSQSMVRLRLSVKEASESLI